MNKNKMAMLISLALVAVAPSAAFAQAAAAAPAASAVEPARLDAARKLMDEIMPPAMRDQMMTSMMQSMMGTMVQALRQNPDFTRSLAAEPKAAAVFDSFVKREQTLATQDLIAGLPSMLDAMARAYARRFTLEQLHDLSLFFATPTGQTYVVVAPTVMSDPDVAQWMTATMRRSQDRLPTELAKLMADLKAALPKGTSHGG
ncbi:MAG: hypothetical protein JWL96_4181 [Sphingomonas bacterium]|uniref:DUF2059 domain-containing protein n=1 Tax=Sphingomonas bacterium TaxID=1895847 RepID=UPI0026387F0C|nr:DUF2059 domain-containing protein [Sphingomonas bacterium]MDB5712111.1 hypothetical protein [Sphingomonas bacterium]